jgi:hypothetical protein
VLKELPDCDIEFPVINNIESILNYHYYTKQSRVINNNDTAKGTTTHAISIN